MPNIGAVFRQEVSRLSRKEIRGQVRGLRKATTQYRRDIAKLKRETIELHTELARLGRRVGDGAALRAPEAEARAMRFNAKGVRSHRSRLGISAADFGKLIGVSTNTVYKWEHGGARPREAQLSSLTALRALGKREAAARLEKLRVQATRGARSK